MLYQARGIRDSSRTNFVCRGSDGAMEASSWIWGRPDVPIGGSEPSALACDVRNRCADLDPRGESTMAVS